MASGIVAAASLAVPLFALRSAWEAATIIVVFVVMTALWCLVALWMVSHPKIGAPIRRFSHVIVPFVLIALGIDVLCEAGSFGLVGLSGGGAFKDVWPPEFET